MIVGKPKTLHLALVGENLLSSETKHIMCFFYYGLVLLFAADSFATLVQLYTPSDKTFPYAI